MKAVTCGFSWDMKGYFSVNSKGCVFLLLPSRTPTKSKLSLWSQLETTVMKSLKQKENGAGYVHGATGLKRDAYFPLIMCYSIL